MAEKSIYKKIKSFTTGHYNRIENAVSSGMPDVHLCIEGKDYFIEVKEVESIDCQVSLRPAQYLWAVNRMRAGGDVYVLIGIKNTDQCILVLNEKIAKLQKPIKAKELGKPVDFFIAMCAIIDESGCIIH